jgi:hypothetical protein
LKEKKSFKSTFVTPRPVEAVGSSNVDGSENSILLDDRVSGCLNAVAITCLLGVATEYGFGRGFIMCCMLFLLDGAGVGGNGVEEGVGAPNILTIQGITKSYAATYK